jgi:hypothetical protein
MSVPISFVTASELSKESKSLQARRPSGAGKYETWKHYHDCLCAVAERYGSVSDSPEPAPDFYFPGDWFHELSDGFASLTPRAISAQALRDFQKIVAAHHAAARLNMGGEIRSPLCGLDILITSSAIFVAWDGESAQDCRAKLQALGAEIA